MNAGVIPVSVAANRRALNSKTNKFGRCPGSGSEQHATSGHHVQFGKSSRAKIEPRPDWYGNSSTHEPPPRPHAHASDTMNTGIYMEPALMATSIRMAAETEKRLDALALRTGRTKAYYLRKIIERGLEEMEDYYLAADVLERVRKGQEAVFTLNDVEHELGLAG